MCMTAVRPLKRKCSLSTESANKMLELSTIDSFATLHLGDNTAKSTYKVNPNSNNASELGKNMSRSCGRHGSSSSSSSSCSDEMQFKMSPQAQSINCGQKPCKIGFKNWKENEKVKEEKRKFIDIVRRRIRTTSLRSEDEQKYSNSSKKSTSKTRDDGFRRGSDGESLMRPRSRTIASPADISLKKLPTVFRWEGTAQQVFIAGSFDNWKSKTPMIKSNDEFYTIIDLPQGDYQYKFLIDGQWQCDPHATISMGDNGVQNNVVSVRESDFEVFEALAVDSVSNGEEKQKGRSGSPVCDYTQEIPTRSSLNSGLYQSGPPVLPPHLLQVILNREVPLHCEPTLLPEPNHVMLNHLYALSIRDGVMVLSSTHRFRKKYVTTLLYRPV